MLLVFCPLDEAAVELLLAALLFAVVLQAPQPLHSGFPKGQRLVWPVMPLAAALPDDELFAVDSVFLLLLLPAAL